jgi:hypothetical protein
MATFDKGIFKSVVVSGETKEIALANSPFKAIMKDATQAHKNWVAKQSTITPELEKAWMVEYVTKNSKGAPGVGFSITMTPAIISTRERPYKFDDVKNEKGKRKYKTNYIIKDKETGKVVGKSDVTKADSKNIGKELYKGGFKGSLVCTYEKQVIEGEPIAWTAKYIPSKGAHNGTYTVFGVIDE